MIRKIDLNSTAKQLMSPLDHSKPRMSLSGGDDQADAIVSGPARHGVTRPCTMFVDHEDLHRAEVSDPALLQGGDVVCGLLMPNQARHVACRSADHADDRVLVILAGIRLQPHDIGLYHVVEVG